MNKIIQEAAEAKYAHLKHNPAVYDQMVRQHINEVTHFLEHIKGKGDEEIADSLLISRGEERDTKHIEELQQQLEEKERELHEIKDKIGSQFSEADLVDGWLRAENMKLQTELATAKEQISKLERENADWKTKYS